VLVLLLPPPLKPLIDIPRMAAIAQKMVRDALEHGGTTPDEAITARSRGCRRVCTGRRRTHQTHPWGVATSRTTARAPSRDGTRAMSWCAVLREPGAG
jgi:hypothetical protein